jgi:hypothetical protein
MGKSATTLFTTGTAVHLEAPNLGAQQIFRYSQALLILEILYEIVVAPLTLGAPIILGLPETPKIIADAGVTVGTGETVLVFVTAAVVVEVARVVVRGAATEVVVTTGLAGLNKETSTVNPNAFRMKVSTRSNDKNWNVS